MVFNLKAYTNKQYDELNIKIKINENNYIMPKVLIFEYSK